MGNIKNLKQLVDEEYGLNNDEPFVKNLPSKEAKKETKRKKEDDDNVISTSFLETPEYILEQITTAGDADDAVFNIRGQSCRFVKYSKLDGEVEIIKKFEYKGKEYHPIVDDIFLKCGVSLPTGIKDYKNTKEIVEQMTQYLVDRIEIPTNPVNYERFLPNLALYYWLYDKFPFIPYVEFVGGTGTGKTTAMEIFGSLCPKPVDSSSSLTIASMFRIATHWRGTLLIDEFEKVGEGSKEIILFLKAGVSNRLLYRTEGEKVKKVAAYIIKSPKIFTSENPISDAGLQSRTIVIKMEKNKRSLPLYYLPEDYEEADEIRNKLLLWKLRNYNKVNLKEIKYGIDELKPFDRRVQQIITPIFYLSEKKMRSHLIEFATEHEQETLRSRKESLDGLIFEYMLDIWGEGGEVQIGKLTENINKEQESRGYRKELTEKKIGNVVRKVINFETEPRGHDKSYWVIRNNDKIKEKATYYGIDLESYENLFTSAENTASPASPAEEVDDETINEIFGGGDNK